MAKQIAQTKTKPSAWIVTPNDKGRKSIKSGKVFLKDKEEFEIELFNPLTVSVLADIKLNGQSVSKTGLVVKPGQRVYLDCFIDDRKKFKFSTYEIENSSEALDATQNNGVLEVFFYKEDVITLNNWQRRFDRIIVEKHYPYNPYPYNPYTIYGSSGVSTFTTNGSNALGTTTTSNVYNSSNNINCSYTSHVDLPNLNVAGSNNIASTIIQILPESRKPAEIKQIKTKQSQLLSSDEVIELIKKLGELHSAGILTDDEFSEKKAELLSKI